MQAVRGRGLRYTAEFNGEWRALPVWRTRSFRCTLPIAPTSPPGSSASPPSSEAVQRTFALKLPNILGTLEMNPRRM